MSTTDQVRDTAAGAMGEVQDRAAHVVDTMKQQVSTRFSDQVGHASDSLGTVSDAVRDVSKHLREEHHETLAEFADRAADQVQRVSGYLEGKDLDKIVDDTERYARQQPMLFVGGAFALGLLAARFLKSSSSNARSSYGWRQERRDMPYRRPMMGMSAMPRAGRVSTPTSPYAGSYAGAATGTRSSGDGTSTASATSSGSRPYGYDSDRPVGQEGSAGRPLTGESASSGSTS
jgi:hypothetical protein